MRLNRLLCISLLSLYPAILFSQIQLIYPDTCGYKVYFDAFRTTPKTQFAEKNIGDDDNLFKRIINQQFSLLVTGQSGTGIGNFASVTPTDGRIDFAGNLLTKNGSVISAKLSGKATDGVVALFSNSTLNTQISGEINYHLLNLGNFSLSYDLDSANNYNTKINQLESGFDLERIKIIKGNGKELLAAKQVLVQNEIDSVQKALQKAILTGISDSIAKEQFVLATKEHLRDSIKGAVVNFPSVRNRLRNLHNKTIAQLTALEFSLPIEGFVMKWWTFGYKVNNNKFKLYNPGVIFSSQIVDTSFVSHEFTGQFSYYRWKSQGHGSIFASIGGGVGYMDNFNTLDKRSVEDTETDTAGTSVRSLKENYIAYEDRYQQDLVTGRFYSDVYYFPFNSHTVGVHLGPEWLMKCNEKPLANIYTGLLLAFKKKDDEKSIVNAELFYQFLDFFKTSENEVKLFERNSIGLRFAFPISFNYK